MNRNVESHFSRLPSAEIQRSVFDRSSDHKTSFNVGDLIPFFVDEVLPGDTFNVTTSKVVRSQTLLTPIMDNIYLDTYYFFVPNRLIWKHWKEFCGENTSGAWAPTVEYTIPSIGSPLGGFQSGTLADYMGLPIGVEWSASDELAPSALPFRAVALICNEFFRDENLSDPLNIPLDDANQVGSNGSNYIADVANGGRPFRAAKYHDYFTSALPAPQKGSSVGIPIDISFTKAPFSPVVTRPSSVDLSSLNTPLVGLRRNASPSLSGVSGWPTYSADFIKRRYVPAVDSMASGDIATFNLFADDGFDPSTTTTTPVTGDSTAHAAFFPINLWADNSGIDFEAKGINFTVNELRLAFAYQRYLESLARNGSRYTELLLGLFGVKSPDARLQRPEYLGGNRVPISISEVTNSAQSEADFLGDLGAKSATSDVNHDFVKSFTEHGYVIGLMVARYDHSYSQGLEKFWSRKTFTDFYNPKFAHLGEVPIYQCEIYTDGKNLNKENVFGYQEIWADYRFKPSRISGEMRPGVPNTLAQWHLSDNYSTVPTLSDSWIREDTSNVDRVLAVTSSVSNQFWADIYIRNKCTRCMPMYSVPGLIDHF